MDETPEELEEIRREAEKIDVNKYKRRFRIMSLAAYVAAAMITVWVLFELKRASRNPCEPVRDHYCSGAMQSSSCAMYQELLRDSVENESATMRSQIRAQCDTKVRELRAEKK